MATTADKKLEKALYGPSLTEVALGAILGLIGGVVVCCVYLVFKPVLLVKEMPAKDKLSISVVYYLPGAESNAKSRTWSAKYKSFAAGKAGNLVLVEDELNAWSNTLSAPPPAPKPGAPAETAAPAADGIFNPGKPNFRIVEGKMQIGFACVLNWYGLTKEVTVKTTGVFKKSGDSFAYSPDTLYLGSCPVHLLPAVSGPLMAHIIGRKKVPDEVKAAWAKLDDVTLEGATLKLVAQ